MIQQYGFCIRDFRCISHPKARFNSFKLSVPASQFERLFDEKLWPEGVVVRIFRTPKSGSTLICFTFYSLFSPMYWLFVYIVYLALRCISYSDDVCKRRKYSMKCWFFITMCLYMYYAFKNVYSYVSKNKNKNKGDRSSCDNHRGISLLSIAGKILARIMLNRITKHILDDVVSESQCGFRKQRGTVDMVFAIRQLQEKCVEQHQDLHLLFIDLTKAFDTVNRAALWAILSKLGCPPRFVQIIRSFHDGMFCRVIENGDASDPFPVSNGVKQGCVLAPTLFSLLFAQMLSAALSQTEAGVKIHYRTDGDFFNLRRLKSYTKVTRAIVRDFLFADDCALVAHSEADLQELADCFATAATSFGLTVSIKKTEMLRQLAPNTARPPPNFTMDGNALKNVDTFKYLGSCINSVANLDDEVLCRISRASQAFGRLHTRVWHERGISIKTKLSVYRAVVLPSLLYGCETWTCYRRHTKKLDQFHLRCLRKVLRVSWKKHVPNQEILRSAELTGIEAMLNQAQLRWSGHVTRMDDSRLPKQLFHGELSTGKRHKGGQRKRYKDVLKSTLKACNIPVDEWQALAQDRPAWRAATRKGTKHFERSRLQSLDDKRSARKNRVPNPSTAVPCQLCGKICASTFGLQAHMRKHQHWRVIFVFEGLLLLLCVQECVQLRFQKRKTPAADFLISISSLDQHLFTSSLHLTFLKHSCINVDPDQNLSLIEWRNNGIKFSFCRCKYVLAQSVHAYNCCKTYFSSLLDAVKTLPVLFH